MASHQQLLLALEGVLLFPSKLGVMNGGEKYVMLQVCVHVCVCACMRTCTGMCIADINNLGSHAFLMIIQCCLSFSFLDVS